MDIIRLEETLLYGNLANDELSLGVNSINGDFISINGDFCGRYGFFWNTFDIVSTLRRDRVSKLYWLRRFYCWSIRIRISSSLQERRHFLLVLQVA